MVDKKERVAILQLDSDEALMKVLASLTEQETDKLKHLLWIVDMERDHCPKKQRSYFSEFGEIYMGDFFIEGDVVNQASVELSELTKRKDAGSMERAFYLKKWLNKKFSK